MNAGEPAISVRGLRKTYGKTTAVNGVELQVEQGEIFALLGPNGAGKTTTVEILEGYRTRTAGEVRVLGVDPAHADHAWRSRVGIVLQGTGEFDELNVGEVVTLFAGYYPDAADPAEVIERVGLTEKTRVRTHTLSGGQKRRLDVALGIIGRPELLFLDEPTTGFDPEARREFWGLIRDLSSTGTTILLTTHYLEEAEALATRVGVISGGRILAVASPAELGGREQGAATVSWLAADGRRTEQTPSPTAYVLDLAKSFDGAEIPGLTVTRPSLEDVYLQLVSTKESA
jgi:ABC-2 type transport system ATP-binding protein